MVIFGSRRRIWRDMSTCPYICKYASQHKKLIFFFEFCILEIFLLILSFWFQIDISNRSGDAHNSANTPPSTKIVEFWTKFDFFFKFCIFEIFLLILCFWFQIDISNRSGHAHNSANTPSSTKIVEFWTKFDFF